MNSVQLFGLFALQLLKLFLPLIKLILMPGLDLDHFKLNPLVLFLGEYEPIGKVLPDYIGQSIALVLQNIGQFFDSLQVSFLLLADDLEPLVFAFELIVLGLEAVESFHCFPLSLFDLFKLRLVFVSYSPYYKQFD